MTTADPTAPSTMTCTVSASVLGQALSLVCRAVSPRSTLPILGNVLLETRETGLRLVATNLDLTIAATVAAEVSGEGRITVPARLLSDYVATLGEAPCSLSVDPAGQTLRLRCGRHRSTLHGIDAVEFPPLPGRDAETLLQLDAAVVERAIGQTVVAASGDEARPVLTGVLLELEGEQLNLVATDGHRLAVRRLQVGDAAGAPLSAIVPARHLAEVARAITPSRPGVALSVSAQRNQIFFDLGDVEISSRLIEGSYPRYAQVIPEDTATRVRVPQAELLREMRTAAVLAKDAANVVRLSLSEDTLVLSAQTAEVGEDEAALPAKVEGPGLQIAFNARYVIDALSVVESQEVELGFNAPLSPGVVRPVGRDDYLYVVMPIRVPV